jgi:cobalt-precorrin 5A hydrolase
VGEAVIVAGIGCRKNASATDVAAAIHAALARAALQPQALDAIATSGVKGAEPGIAAAAAHFGLPLVLVSQGDLAAADGRTATRSERVLALTGVASLAEAAALAAGGPQARLLTPRIVSGGATCALAHDPEKWVPVFGKRSCSNNRPEQDDDSKKSHRALAGSGDAP